MIPGITASAQPIIPAAAGGTFGTGTGSGSTWNINPGQILLNRLATPSDYAGAVEKLTFRVYTDTASGTTVKGLIYAMTGLDATALLGTSDVVTLTGAETTIDLVFATPVAGLAASTVYGFGLIADGDLFFGDMVDGGDLCDSLGQDYASPPTSLTLDDDSGSALEMAVTYAP